MTYWQTTARNKRMKEKQVSKKTREDFMKAYHTLRNQNEQQGKDGMETEKGMERLPGEPDKNPRPEV